MKFLEWLFGSVLVNEWLWSFLPDKCEQPNCCRKGALGNENIKKDGTIECDYCSSREMAKRDLWLKGYYSAVMLVHGDKPWGMDETGRKNYDVFGDMSLDYIQELIHYQEQTHKIRSKIQRPEAVRAETYHADLQKNDHWFPKPPED
jgi:DNA-directed RNA polymerase subunit RPC12/RpoP